MFKAGQKVYFITNLKPKLYEGVVKPSEDEDVVRFIDKVSVKTQGAWWEIPKSLLFSTPEEALKNAFEKNQKEQTKLAEQYQDLIRIEAELNLKEKGETK